MGSFCDAEWNFLVLQPLEIQARLFTLGELAVELKTPRHRIKYAIERYEIAPVMRVGITRVWSSDSLPVIALALRRISQKRGHSA